MLLVVLCGIIVSASALFIQVARTLTPTQQVKNAWQTIQLSGAYDVTSTIDQYTTLSPSMSNAGMQEQHQRFRIDGHINESTQSSHIRITDVFNESTIIEIRRERGKTFTRQGTKWVPINTSELSQLNMLSLLVGIKDVTIQNAQQRIFMFTFDGNTFAHQMRQAFIADNKKGITHNQQWQDVSANAQFRASTGSGTIQIDDNGLPQTVNLELFTPATTKTQAVRSLIVSTYSNYARTGLELKRLMNQPLAIIAQYFGTSDLDISAFTVGIIVLGIVMTVASIFLLWRRRLYLPLSLIVIGMLIYQPYSSIPHTIAATDTRASPTDVHTQSTPTVVFTPLKSAAVQGLGLALPNASTSNSSYNTTASMTRDASTTSGADDDKDGLSNSEEVKFNSNPSVADTDSDGLDDKAEYLYKTNPRDVDSDSDKLSDFAEIQIGTSPLHQDSDADGIPDFVEVTYPNNYGSIQLYSNPLSKDTNNDGLLDGAECLNRVYSVTAIPPIIPDCIDTDQDNIPDFLDNDNDNDGVSDSIDLSSQKFLPDQQNANQLFGENDSFPLKVNDIPVSNAVRPVVVELQIVPINLKSNNIDDNKRMLYLDNSIYDWPSNDKLGQVQRSKNTTFRTYAGSQYTDDHSLQGDMRVSGSLEVRIPVSTSDFGGLPLKSCEQTNTCKENVPRWLNTEKLQEYGISAVYSLNADNSRNINEVTLTIPISPVLDPATRSVVAYSSRLYYENNGTNWLNAHRVRLQWIVSSVQDFCPDDSEATCTDADRVENISVVQTYYGNWMLTGASVTDYVSPYEMAVVVEDASSAAVSNPVKRRKEVVNAYAKIDEVFLSNPLWNISDDSNKRMSIVQQFDSRTNNDIRTNQLGLDLSSFTATYKTYATESEQYYVFVRDTQPILDSTVCRNFGKNNCTEQEVNNLKLQCLSIASQNDIRCMPAVMYVGNNKQRDGGLLANGQLSLSNQLITNRSLSTSFFRVDRKIDDTNVLVWRSMSVNEINDDIEIITQQISQTSTPITDPVQANNFTTYGGALSTLMVLLMVSNSSIRSFTDSEIAGARSRSISLFNTSPSNTWGDYVNSFLTRYIKLLNLSENVPAPSSSENLFDKYSTEDWKIAQSAYQSLLDSPEVAIPTMLASLALLFANPIVLPMLVAGLAGRYGYAGVRYVLDHEVLKKSLILVKNVGILLYKLFNYLVESLVSSIASALTGTTESMFKSVSAGWKASSKIGKALTVIGFLIG
jgi:hypothetical protein